MLKTYLVTVTVDDFKVVAENKEEALSKAFEDIKWHASRGSNSINIHLFYQP